MFRRLIVNTMVSAGALLVSAAIPLLLVPLIVNQHGIVKYGVLVLVRILLPTGAFAVFDFGNSEIATQTIVRARHDGDWQHAARRLLGLGTITLTAGLIVAAALWFATPHLGVIFKVPAEIVPEFERIIRVTSVVFTALLLTLILEGVLRGFEAFKSLRTAEVSCSLVYGAAAVAAVVSGLGFEWIAFGYLASLLLRGILILAMAVQRLRGRGLQFVRPRSEDWSDIVRRCRLIAGNRLLGTAQGQAPPLVVGALLGTGAAGIYDVIIRFPRFVKVLIGFMNSAVLPVSARLDVMADQAGMRRLGELGLLGVLGVAAPICTWGAAFSEPVLRLWIGESFAVYWPWQSLMYLVPLVSAMASFSGTALMNRPHVVAKLNAITLAQLVIQYALAIGLMHLFAERAFVLGQVVAMLLTFPLQMWLVAFEKQLAWHMFRRHAATSCVLVAATVLCLLVDAAGQVRSAIDLALALFIWIVLAYAAMWRFTLHASERAALLSMVRARRRPTG